MTATLRRAKSLYFYPPGSFERNLYQRLFAIGIDPQFCWGFRTLASEAAHYALEIHPVDLSTEAIRDALIVAAKKERKAQRKRRRAGEYQPPFPLIWEAFIRTTKNGCRFQMWCRGKCEPDANGCRDHWSIPCPIKDATYGDELVLQVFQSEDPDGLLSVAEVCLTWHEGGDHYGRTFNLSLTPAEARKYGEALHTAADLKGMADRKPGVVIDLHLASDDRLVFERLRDRVRLNGTREREIFEIQLFPAGQGAPLRMRSDYSNPWHLGKRLMSAADDAEGVISPKFDGWDKLVEEAGR